MCTHISKLCAKTVGPKIFVSPAELNLAARRILVYGSSSTLQAERINLIELG